MAFELIKVSELPELMTPADANVLPIQDGDYLKRISFANLKDAAVGDTEGSLAAAYDSTATYAVGDYCIYEGQLYRCTTAITTAEAWTAGHWTVAVLTDDIASDLSAEASTRSTNDNALAADIAEALGDLAAVYSSSATYAVGDYCTKDGQLYRCTTAITTAEAWTAAHWSAVALGDDTRDLRSALTSEISAREAADNELSSAFDAVLDYNGINNSFDGNYYNGYWSSSGVLTPSNVDICCATMIPCPENANVVLKTTTEFTDYVIYISYFDEAGTTRIRRDVAYSAVYKGVSPEETHYFAFTYEKFGANKDNFGTSEVYINNTIARVLSMIAPIEDGTTASKAYTTGQYFLHNNVFCKALTSIASGATFTLNTNYTETTIAAELYTALH